MMKQCKVLSGEDLTALADICAPCNHSREWLISQSFPARDYRNRKMVCSDNILDR